MIMPAENTVVQRECLSFVFDQLPEHRKAVEIIIRDWSRCRDEIFHRPLILTELRNHWGKLQYHVLQVDGTPPRGMVIVSVDVDERDGNVFRTSQSTTTIRGRKAEIVRNLVSTLLESVQ